VRELVLSLFLSFFRFQNRKNLEHRSGKNYFCLCNEINATIHNTQTTQMEMVVRIRTTLTYVLVQLIILLLVFRYGQDNPKNSMNCKVNPTLLNSTYYDIIDPKSAPELFKDANVGAGSDKVMRHGYHEAYGPFLSPYLRTPGMSVLEIGVQNGNSLKLWQNLFPGHQLIAGVCHGTFGSIKLNGFKSQFSERVVLYQGDQSDPKFWKVVEEDLKGHKFDIIVDDGSHVPWHQIFTLETIFGTLLKEGGIYIVEDVETSYWDRKDRLPSIYGMYEIRGAGVGTRGSVVQKLKEISEVLNRRFFNMPSFSILKSKVDHEIASISFSRNCIVLMKKVKERWKLIDKMDSDKKMYRPSACDPKSEAFKQYHAKVDYVLTGTPPLS